MRNLLEPKREIRQAFEAKMVECLTKCQSNTTTKIPLPPLYFKQMGRRAGLFSYRPLTFGRAIFINPDFLFNGGYDEQLNQTLPHEMAHYVDSFLNGRCDGHGPRWKRIARWMDIKPERCHNMSTEGVKIRQHLKPYQYSCGCQGKTFHLTPRAHGKHQNQPKGYGYKCPRCRWLLIYQGMVINGKLMTPKVASQTPSAISKMTSSPVVELIEYSKPVSIIIKPINTPKFKTVTRFINGALVNERVPIDNMEMADTLPL